MTELQHSWTLSGFQAKNPLDRYFLGLLLAADWERKQPYKDKGYIPASDKRLWTEYLKVSEDEILNCQNVARTWPDTSMFASIHALLKDSKGKPLKWSKYVEIAKLAKFDPKLRDKATEAVLTKDLKVKEIVQLKPKKKGRQSAGVLSQTALESAFELVQNAFIQLDEVAPREVKAKLLDQVAMLQKQLAGISGRLK